MVATPATVALPAPGWARLRASLWDYLVIVGWIAVLTVAGLGVRARLPPAPEQPSLLATDAMAFGFSVLPVLVYLTVTEARPAQATWGKRRGGLLVVGPGGRRPGWGRAAARNAVKLLPWQLAHIAVARLILGVDDVVTIVVTDGLAIVIPVVSVAMVVLDPQRRALHDRVAGTRVVVNPA